MNEPHPDRPVYVPMRLKELENAAYAIATTGATVMIKDDWGNPRYVGPCDLAELRRQIVRLQSLDRILKPYLS